MHDVMTGFGRRIVSHDNNLFDGEHDSSYKQDMDMKTMLNEDTPSKVAKVAPKTGEEDIRERDKFYTKPEVAQACMDYVREKLGKAYLDSVGTWLEPSAGAGAFLTLMPRNRIGIDLAPVPNVQGVEQGNFLEWDHFRDHPGPMVTVGNPPFGKNASLALKFVNRHARGRKGDYVCFILPRTFEKPAMQQKVSHVLKLVHTMALDPNSFTHDGDDYPVPCCFQIWENVGHENRNRHVRATTHPDFDIVSGEFGLDAIPADKKPHFAFQRVGGGAGTVSYEGMHKSWRSHYLIKANIEEKELFARLTDMLPKWHEIRVRTAGNPSIGKNELVEAYTAYLVKRGLEPSVKKDDGRLL